MPRPAWLGVAISPSAIYERDLPDSPLDVDFFRLSDAKSGLNIPLEESADDARLLIMINDAVGHLEVATGRRLTATNMTAEYSRMVKKNQPWSTLRLPMRDATVTSVTKFDEKGETETTIPAADYEVVYKNKEPYIRLHPSADPFIGGYGVAVRVHFTVKMDSRSADVRLMRVLLNELMAWQFNGKEGADPRESYNFQRNLNSLRETGGTIYRVF